MKQINIPVRYLPKRLTRSDKRKQLRMLMKSRKLYKKNKYYTRKKLSSYKSKPSKHVQNAKRIYNIETIKPSKELSKKTKCSLATLKKIVNKGEGAYFSSGSRPNQTAQSWGIARLASALTGGKSALVDFNLIKNGCSPTGKAYKMALQRFGL
jgi:CRISPR/Cas system CSM-associated protein Csm4 (group 5 of RAMP superfamily)